MSKTIINSLALLAPLSALMGCNSGSGQTQPVTGKVALSTFPAPVTSVRARRPGSPDILAPVAPDGSFTLSLPTGRSYRLDFLAAHEGARLVFPRRRGVLESTFEVRGAGPAVDVGGVRYLGDARKRTFAFTSAVDACEDAEELVDAQAGVVCVNDPDPPPPAGEACGGQGVGEVNVPDPPPPAGEASGGQGVGEVPDPPGPAGEEGEAWVGETAVAERNLPASLGCEDEPTGDEEGGAVGPVGKE